VCGESLQSYITNNLCHSFVGGGLFIIVCPFYHWHQCWHIYCANPCLLVSLLVSTTGYSVAAGTSLTGRYYCHVSVACCMRLPSSRACLDSLVLFCLVVSVCFIFLFYIYNKSRHAVSGMHIYMACSRHAYLLTWHAVDRHAAGMHIWHAVGM
jgi:hypothetical protein